MAKNYSVQHGGSDHPEEKISDARAWQLEVQEIFSRRTVRPGVFVQDFFFTDDYWGDVEDFQKYIRRIF